MSRLEIRQLCASYGVSQALFGVDMDVGRGEVVALMGRNGMGKTTTVKAICRMLPATGRLSFAGQDLHALPSHRIARLGIGLVPEGRRCFSKLSVKENLIAAARPGAWTVETVSQLFPRLGERLGQHAGSLSGGEQQMLAIGRALMTNPSLMILDEATEGLAPLVRQEIWDAITMLKLNTGLSILIVDKSLQELRKLADRGVILERGRTVWTGKMMELTDAITDARLGVGARPNP